LPHTPVGRSRFRQELAKRVFIFWWFANSKKPIPRARSHAVSYTDFASGLFLSLPFSSVCSKFRCAPGSSPTAWFARGFRPRKPRPKVSVKLDLSGVPTNNFYTNVSNHLCADRGGPAATSFAPTVICDGAPLVRRLRQTLVHIGVIWARMNTVGDLGKGGNRRGRSIACLTRGGPGVPRIDNAAGVK